MGVMPRKTAGPKAGGKKAGSGSKHFDPLSVGLGDSIRVERRFIVDGQLTSVADKGIFHGIQAMGSIEHILLETDGEVRLIPIPSISEIVLEGIEGKKHAAPSFTGWDPSFA